MAETRGLIDEVLDAQAQPPPGALREDAGFHVDAESVMQIAFDGYPVVEDGFPTDLLRPYWFVLLGWCGGVPVTQPGFWVVWPTARVICAVRVRPRVILAIGAV